MLCAKCTTKIDLSQLLVFSGGSAVIERQAGIHRQPLIHLLLSRKSRHWIGNERRVITASIKQCITAPSSLNSTSVIKKCFSLLTGRVAVHLLLRSFLGLTVFIFRSGAYPANSVYFLALPRDISTGYFWLLISILLRAAFNKSISSLSASLTR